VRTKYVKKTSVGSVRAVYVLEKLPDVSGSGLVEVGRYKEQEQLMEEGDDDPHLDLEGDQEMQAYNLIKNHEFVHMPAYDLDFL
jgi:hypothetical protein